MFGKNKKFSASQRFQRRDFKRRVNAARGYKRTIRKAPETQFQTLLSNLGLGSKITQITIVVVLCILLYLTFIPNFLFIKNVKIDGVSDQSGVQNTINDYFNHSGGLWPQRNIVFLNKNLLENYITSHNPSVLKVVSLKKKPWNKIAITIQPRVERFSLSADDKEVILYNDGVAARTLSGDEHFPPGLAHLKVSTNDEIRTGDQYLPAIIAQKLEEIFNTFPGNTAKVLDYIQIPVTEEKSKPIESLSSTEPSTPIAEVNEKEDLNLNEFILFVKKDPTAKDDHTDFRIYIDPTQDAADMETIARQMFTQLADKFGALYYMDLRFKGKAYVCLRNAPCAKAPVPVATPPPAAVVPTPTPAGEATKPQK